MKVDVSKFESVISRATVLGAIDYVNMTVTRETVKAKLVSGDKTVISILNLPNDEIFVWEDKDKVGEFTLDFENPAVNVNPFLDVIEDQFATLNIKKEAIELVVGGAKTKLCLAYPQEAKIFIPDAPQSKVKPYAVIQVTDEVRLAYAKVKPLVSRTGKFYVVAEGKSFFFEAGDRTNPSSNEVKSEVQAIDGDDGSLKVINVPFKTFDSIMKIIGRSDKFTMHPCYVADTKSGFIGFMSEDVTERYYLLGARE